MPTLVLSDGTLRVDVVPQYGGKVYAMTHLPTNTSLLHSPVTRQPIQSARLGAQVDGGIEWNWSPGMLGHWVGTQRDVFAATLQTSRGPALRIYDYDRWNDTFFQACPRFLSCALARGREEFLSFSQLRPSVIAADGSVGHFRWT